MTTTTPTPTTRAVEGSRAPTVLFAAGGTGGHIYPALAVADAMTELVPGLQVVFVGTSHGLESHIVPRHGRYPLELIDVRFLKGVGPLKTLKHLALLPRSGWQSWRLLRRVRPGLVIGAGGYASGPVVGIAALTGRPTAILEQNAIPGLTNKLLGRFVDRVFVSFEAQRFVGAFAEHKVRALGNPVRSMQVEGADVARTPGATHVLVFGGSQGARSLNEEMPRILGELAARLGPEAASRLVVRHQSGRGRDAPVRAAYAERGLGERAVVSEFIDDMPGAYAWADLVVCRAGATSCAELKAAGKAAVLVPFPHAAHNHQEENARAMLEAGAAQMVLDEAMSGSAMVDVLERCLREPDAVRAMEARARELAQPLAAHDVARECLALMGTQPQPQHDNGELGRQASTAA